MTGLKIAPNLIVALSERELATVLAALAYWRREGLHSSGSEHEVASHYGALEPLAPGDIDALMEQLSR